MGRDLFIGVNGGHRMSAAVAISSDKVLAVDKGKSLNFHLYDPETVAVSLAELLTSLARQINLQSVDDLRDQTTHITFALPGASTLNDQLVAEKILEMIGWKGQRNYDVVDDTWAGLIGGALDREGICVIAGSGASVFVGLGEFPFPPGKPHKKDGWGAILGDFGSGFELAQELFRYIGRYYDLHGKPPPIFESLLKYEPKIMSIDNVQSWFDTLTLLEKDWRVRFAKMADVVTASAELDNEDAIRLVKKSAINMAETIDIALQGFQDKSKDLTIFLQGGMFEYSAIYTEKVMEIINASHPNRRIQKGYFKPVFGAALMAVAEDKILPKKEKIQNIINSVYDLPREKSLILTYDPINVPLLLPA